MRRHPQPFLLILIFLFSTSLKAQDTLVTGSSLRSAEARDALSFHNKVRADVGAPPLQWSADLAAYAQRWANHLAATGCKMKHRPYDGEWTQLYGENIFAGMGRHFTATDASNSWYNEIRQYKHGVLTNENWYPTGHYTQMVWRTTTHVGIATAKCSNSTYIIVANYSPGGNVIGQKAY